MSLTTYLGEGDCRGLTTTVQNAGGTVPQPWTDILKTMDAVKKWQPPTATNVARLAATGELNPTNAGTALTKAHNQPQVKAADLRQSAINGLVTAFATAVADSADDMIASLRTQFDSAADGVRVAAEHVTPGMTAEQVLEAGPDASAAWVALDEHRKTLDQVHDVVVTLVSTFDILGDPPAALAPNASRACTAAFFIDESRLAHLQQVAAHFASENRLKHRGGFWYPLLAMTDLTLNSATQAAAIIDEYR